MLIYNSETADKYNTTEQQSNSRLTSAIEERSFGLQQQRQHPLTSFKRKRLPLTALNKQFLKQLGHTLENE